MIILATLALHDVIWILFTILQLTKVQTFSDDSGNQTENNNLPVQYFRLFEDLNETDQQT